MSEVQIDTSFSRPGDQVVTDCIIATVVIAGLAYGAKLGGPWLWRNVGAKKGDTAWWSWYGKLDNKEQQHVAARIVFAIFHFVATIFAIWAILFLLKGALTVDQAAIDNFIATRNSTNATVAPPVTSVYDGPQLESSKPKDTTTTNITVNNTLSPEGLPRLSLLLGRSASVTVGIHGADILIYSIVDQTVSGYMNAAVFLHRLSVPVFVITALLFKFNVDLVTWMVFFYNVSALSDVFFAALLPYTPQFFSALFYPFTLLNSFIFLVTRTIFTLIFFYFIVAAGAKENVYVFFFTLFTFAYFVRALWLVIEARYPLVSKAFGAGTFKEVSPELYRKSSELTVEFFYLDWLLSTYVFKNGGGKKLREFRRKQQKNVPRKNK